MNPICRALGHKPPQYGNDAAYGRLVLGGVDGIGTRHAHVEAECDRCGKRFTVIRVHLPETDSKKNPQPDSKMTIQPAHLNKRLLVRLAGTQMISEVHVTEFSPSHDFVQLQSISLLLPSKSWHNVANVEVLEELPPNVATI